MTTFHAHLGEVFIGSAKLNHDSVQQLKRLFAKELAWEAFDALVAAEDEAAIQNLRRAKEIAA